MDTTKEVGKWFPVKDLVPWDQNPRFNNHVIDKVIKSINEFGWGSPVLARLEDRRVIAGHTRIKAAEKMGLEFIPVRFLSGLTDEQANKLALADNKLNELAEWDEDQLYDLLKDLDEDAIMDLGWSKEELDNLFDESLLHDIPTEPESEINEFDCIPDEVDPITKLGDVITIGKHVLYCDDNIKIMKSMKDNSIDSIVTDPPYGIDFMNKTWDSLVPGGEWASECLRILKPGGHLISFGATRTYHKLVTNLENAGFEVRDTINWLYFSGFPKSLNLSAAIDKHFGAEREIVGKEINWGNASKSTPNCANGEWNITKPATKEAKEADGIGTALKPAFEPATLCRKPLSEKTVVLNWLKHGTGGLNIDQCRLAVGDKAWVGPHERPGWADSKGKAKDTSNHHTFTLAHNDPKELHDLGRWPANIYQCPKASRGEREEGLDDMSKNKRGEFCLQNHNGKKRQIKEVANIHPTVKPVKLMSFLIKLITPKDGVVLDMFCGSGSTMIAAEKENYRSIGIEREPKYCDIIQARLKNAIGE